MNSTLGCVIDVNDVTILIDVILKQVVDSGE